MDPNEQIAAGSGSPGANDLPTVAEVGVAILRPASIPLSSERKVVTILFADAVESTKLVEALDPEEAADRLNPLLRAMVNGIHQFGGTVIRSEGDAIIALFGAPHAYEDHAVRACHAAIAILRHVAELNDDALKIRIALNSGEVMVRPMVRDVSVEYEVTGVAMHVASRVEALARPGTILATAATMQLVGRRVNATPLGNSEVRGLSAPIELFEISSFSLAATPWDARLAFGLTPFVGHTFETNVLLNAIQSARTGRGQLIEIIGEAGVGKSRLVYEATNAAKIGELTLLVGGAASYAQNYPYFVFRNLFAKVFGIDGQDDDAAVGEKLSVGLSADQSLASLIPAFRSLFGLRATDLSWTEIDPVDRRRLTITAVCDFVFKLARDGIVMCVLEDLQWIDDQSRAALEYLVRGIDNMRLLICVTSRKGTPSIGAFATSYVRLPIQPLDQADALGMLEYLVNEAPELGELKHSVVGKAQGNPFFLEELARMLSTSTARQTPHPQSKVTSHTNFQLPNTIQSVVAARVDQLSVAEKELLQVACVVGGDISASVLQRVSGLSKATLEKTLALLIADKFLFNSNLTSEGEYSFYHALTQEVVYRSLLKERRRTLHAATCNILAELQSERIEKPVEQLGYHAELGELWEQAVQYLRQSGLNAIERSAYKEAIRFLERALGALGHLPATKLRAEVFIELRLMLRVALGATGDYRQLYEHLSLAEQESIAINDRLRLGAICIAKTHVLNMLGDINEAVTNGTRACELAKSNRDADQSLMANYFLAQAHEFKGDYGAVVHILSGDLAGLQRAKRHARVGMTGTNSILGLGLLSHSLAYLGAFAEAERHATEACAIAEETRRPYDAGIAHFSDGIVKICRGRIGESIETLEAGWHSCKEAGIDALLPMIGSRLGFAYSISGHIEKGAELLDFCRLHSENAIHVHGWSLSFSGWVEHRRGATTSGMARQNQAVQLAKQHSYRGMEVWSRWLLGTMLFEGGRFLEASEVLEEGIALATSLEMWLHSGYCYEVLAEVCGGLGQPDEARRAQQIAAHVFEEHGKFGRLKLDHN